MAREIPAAPKIYTTTYESFKGVDFTNDPSNVWYRRTPDGVNMLPDESGRPFKRTGWGKVITADDFAQKYYDDNYDPLDEDPVVKPSEISVRKCYYFDLAGTDHIVIFTNYGVFLYRDGELVSYPTISYDQDLIDSFDRAFFFEGNGKAAFYIYGGFKIWEYAYAGEDTFTWNTVEPHIPRVNIAVDARHEAGTSYESVNMLSDYICEDFQDNGYLYVSASSTTVSGGSVSVDNTQFIAMVGSAGTYEFTYTYADHSWLLSGDQVMISNYGINLTGSSPADGNKITVVLSPAYRINLPRVITSTTGMEVRVSATTQFDTPLQIITSGSVTSGKVLLKKDQDDNFSHLEFAQAYAPLVDGEDCIRVVYPRNAIATISHTVNTGSISVTADKAEE